MKPSKKDNLEALGWLYCNHQHGTEQECIDTLSALIARIRDEGIREGLEMAARIASDFYMDTAEELEDIRYAARSIERQIRSLKGGDNAE